MAAATNDRAAEAEEEEPFPSSSFPLLTLEEERLLDPAARSYLAGSSLAVGAADSEAPPAADDEEGDDEASSSSPLSEVLDRLVASPVRSLQGPALDHSNWASEQDGNDADGQQGGQLWSEPTAKPTGAPTTAPPTASPTDPPTLRGRQFVLRGLMWYDRNANGRRDSNVVVQDVDGLEGNDVEYQFGVGGVTVSLVQCDPDTGRAHPSPDQDTYAVTTTIGYDNLMRPQVVPNDDENGKFNIHLNGLEMNYYVQAEAPPGYLLTAGVCHSDYDDDPDSPFRCPYENSVDTADDVPVDVAGGNRRLRRAQQEDLTEEYGIASGRSTRCVYVDKYGHVSRPLNFGVMRVGDTQEVGTQVALVLEFDADGVDTAEDGEGGEEEDSAAQAFAGGRSLRGRTLKVGSNRFLLEAMSRAAVLDQYDDGHTVTTRYLMAEKDKRAIGTVTAEVLAGALDGRLAEHGVELNSVDPKEVVLSGSRASGTQEVTVASNQLAVNMDIKGHYSPPPRIDFDYIVQDSINRDTAVIRRGLREFNDKCSEQTTKVRDQGADEGAFDAVVSTSGAARPGRGGGRVTDVSELEQGDVFSTACSSDLKVPEYFETSLKEIEARRVEVKAGPSIGALTFTEGNSGGLAPWAAGPVAGLSGLVVLLAGAFVFRRALGPRRADAYSDLRETKQVVEGEGARFGEGGGAGGGGGDDDGSVDSAFYSDSDEDFEETEKERKMRRKRKEKMDDHRGSKLSRSTRAKKKAGGASRHGSIRNLKASFGGQGERGGGGRGGSSARHGSIRGLKASARGREGAEDLKQLSTVSEDTNSRSGSSKDDLENIKAKEGSRARGSSSSRPSSGKKRSSSSKRRSRASKEGSGGRGASGSGTRGGSSSRRGGERRGRSKRNGGDNARAVTEARIV